MATGGGSTQTLDAVESRTHLIRLLDHVVAVYNHISNEEKIIYSYSIEQAIHDVKIGPTNLDIDYSIPTSFIIVNDPCSEAISSAIQEGSLSILSAISFIASVLLSTDGDPSLINSASNQLAILTMCVQKEVEKLLLSEDSLLVPTSSSSSSSPPPLPPRQHSLLTDNHLFNEEQNDSFPHAHFGGAFGIQMIDHPDRCFFIESDADVYSDTADPVEALSTYDLHRYLRTAAPMTNSLSRRLNLTRRHSDDSILSFLELYRPRKSLSKSFNLWKRSLNKKITAFRIKLSNRRNKTDTGTTREQCVICYERNADVVLKPCSHSDMCFHCASNLLDKEMPCPFCRADIKKISPIK